ncbi:hypothetical protein AB2B38_006555 [Balneola sp. MJW-20]|uniref:hypothetical protein n=1 Tax=Gracilimonas aurantiaca TaxID=3234185 RepID=UPI0034668A28
MKHSLKFIGLLFLMLFVSQSAMAQFGEPEVKRKTSPRNLYDEGFRNGYAVYIALNDFGFGVSGQYRKVLNPYTELLITAGVGGLRDPSEQTFIDYTFGFRTIPDKYRRVVNFPIFVGFKQRVFPEAIQDNFRPFYSLSGGPVFALSVPYFDDTNDNGFRENDRLLYGFNENVYDVFTGWGNTKSHFGFGGEFILGVDFGENFASLTSVQFGYTVRYFNEGIQILEPFKPDLSEQGFPQDNNNDGLVDVEPFNDKRKFFGSVQITFVFGIMR